MLTAKHHAPGLDLLERALFVAYDYRPEDAAAITWAQSL
jgi:hypothetical protein